MQYKKFLLPLTDDGRQEAELNSFLRGHRVLKVESRYIDDAAMWAFLVSYMDGEQQHTAPPAGRNGSSFEPAKELTPEQLRRYELYSDVRLQMARKHDVKAFIIFSNRDLAAIAKNEPLTVETLRQVKGIGESRIEQYGQEFVQTVNDTIAARKASDDETSGTLDGAGGAS